jgi:hypothetical protein
MVLAAEDLVAFQVLMAEMVAAALVEKALDVD